ncbi:MAG: hypothetical protein ACLGPL_05775, partial [Acidobacteriota bacterium]
SDTTKLREQRRPLWMSSLGIDHPADMIGGGGDIWADRLVPEYPRFYGQDLELSPEDEEAAKSYSKDYEEMEGFPPQSETTRTTEEAFKYVRSEGE